MAGKGRMISGDFIGRMMDRLSGLSYYPSAEGARRDLGKALMTARNEGIILQVIEGWLQNYTEAPKPAQLHALIASENNKIRDDERARNAPCSRCDGTGFVIVGSGVYTGAKPCDCLSPTHHARPETTEYQENEREYWKPHWKFDKQDIR